MSVPADKLMLSVKEAAEISGIGRTTLRQKIHEGKIPVLKVGTKSYIPRHLLRTALEKMVREQLESQGL